jgi:hypothetical protein
MAIFGIRIFKNEILDFFFFQKNQNEIFLEEELISKQLAVTNRQLFTAT